MQRAKYVDNGRRQHMASVVVVVAVAVAVAAVALRVYDCVNKLTQGRKQSIDTKAIGRISQGLVFVLLRFSNHVCRSGSRVKSAGTPPSAHGVGWC